MNLPRWVLMYIKKSIPNNFVGEIHIFVRQTGTVEVMRQDKVTERLFRERWAEVNDDLPPQLGEPNGKPSAYGSTHERSARTE